MKLPISDRLLACCGFVSPGERVADIGCDAGGSDAIGQQVDGQISMVAANVCHPISLVYIIAAG